MQERERAGAAAAAPAGRQQKREVAAARERASRQCEVLKVQQESRCGDALASVRQRGGSVSESVRWRSQMPGASRVPPDNLVVVGGLLRSDWVRAASKGTAVSCFLSLQFSCGGTRDELPSRGI